MPYEAKAIANEILKIAESQRQAVSPMKLQKLVFFAHGWNLAITGDPLITERIEAWTYGPVIRSIYKAFRSAGSEQIKSRAVEITPIYDAGSTKLEVYEPSIDFYPDEEQNRFTRELLQEIWNVYGGFTAVQLSNITHMRSTPWFETWEKNRDQSAVVIDDELIKRYFTHAAESSATQGTAVA